MRIPESSVLSVSWSSFASLISSTGLFTPNPCGSSTLMCSSPKLLWAIKDEATTRSPRLSSARTVCEPIFHDISAHRAASSNVLRPSRSARLDFLQFADKGLTSLSAKSGRLALDPANVLQSVQGRRLHSFRHQEG